MIDILAIAAHPDDVEQTCGGTLIRMAETGYRTGVLDLTAGDMGTRGTPERRIEESEVAARHLLLEWRGNLHFPDARLENTISARMTLAVKIRELRPRVVILSTGDELVDIDQPVGPGQIRNSNSYGLAAQTRGDERCEDEPER